MASFGWSVGDVVKSTKVLVSVIQAFKTKDGAQERYQQDVAFLESLEITLRRLKGLADSDEDYASDLSTQLEVLNKPLKDFTEFAERYEASLADSTDLDQSAIRKSPRVVKYALRDLQGEVETLRMAIAHPLGLINTRLNVEQL
jgi:hypothetical protein